jgi:hypothetical protein
MRELTHELTIVAGDRDRAFARHRSHGQVGMPVQPGVLSNPAAMMEESIYD